MKASSHTVGKQDANTAAEKSNNALIASVLLLLVIGGITLLFVFEILPSPFNSTNNKRESIERIAADPLSLEGSRVMFGRKYNRIQEKIEHLKTKIQEEESKHRPIADLESQLAEIQSSVVTLQGFFQPLIAELKTKDANYAHAYQLEQEAGRRFACRKVNFPWGSNPDKFVYQLKSSPRPSEQRSVQNLLKRVLDLLDHLEVGGSKERLSEITKEVETLRSKWEGRKDKGLLDKEKELIEAYKDIVDNIPDIVRDTNFHEPINNAQKTFRALTSCIEKPLFAFSFSDNENKEQKEQLLDAICQVKKLDGKVSCLKQQIEICQLKRQASPPSFFAREMLWQAENTCLQVLAHCEEKAIASFDKDTLHQLKERAVQALDCLKGIRSGKYVFISSKTVSPNNIGSHMTDLGLDGVIDVFDQVIKEGRKMSPKELNKAGVVMLEVAALEKVKQHLLIQIAVWLGDIQCVSQVMNKEVRTQLRVTSLLQGLNKSLHAIRSLDVSNVDKLLSEAQTLCSRQRVVRDRIMQWWTSYRGVDIRVYSSKAYKEFRSDLRDIGVVVDVKNRSLSSISSHLEGIKVVAENTGDGSQVEKIIIAQSKLKSEWLTKENSLVQKLAKLEQAVEGQDQTKLSAWKEDSILRIGEIQDELNSFGLTDESSALDSLKGQLKNQSKGAISFLLIEEVEETLLTIAFLIAELRVVSSHAKELHSQLLDRLSRLANMLKSFESKQYTDSLFARYTDEIDWARKLENHEILDINVIEQVLNLWEELVKAEKCLSSHLDKIFVREAVNSNSVPELFIIERSNLEKLQEILRDEFDSEAYRVDLDLLDKEIEDLEHKGTSLQSASPANEEHKDPSLQGASRENEENATISSWVKQSLSDLNKKYKAWQKEKDRNEKIQNARSRTWKLDSASYNDYERLLRLFYKIERRKKVLKHIVELNGGSVAEEQGQNPSLSSWLDRYKKSCKKAQTLPGLVEGLRDINKNLSSYKAKLNFLCNPPSFLAGYIGHSVEYRKACKCAQSDYNRMIRQFDQNDATNLALKEDIESLLQALNTMLESQVSDGFVKKMLRWKYIRPIEQLKEQEEHLQDKFSSNWRAKARAFFNRCKETHYRAQQVVAQMVEPEDSDLPLEFSRYAVAFCRQWR